MQSVRLVPFCFGLALFGCASDRDALEKRLSGMREDITHLQAENDRLAERLDGLEVKASAAREKPATPPAAQDRPPLKVVKLAPDDALALANAAEVAPEDRPDAPGSRPVIRLRGKADGRADDSPRTSVKASEDKP